MILFPRAYRQNRDDSVRRALGGALHYDILLTHVPDSTTWKRTWEIVATMLFGLDRFSGLVRPETDPLPAIRRDNPL